MLRIFTILLFISHCLFAQTNTARAGYTRCTWPEIQLMDSSYYSSDSSAVIVTTRGLTAEISPFLTNHIASDSALRFFTVYFKGNQWRAAPRISLASALDERKDKGDYIVYTEGDGKTFPDNIDRVTRMNRLYQVNVILFDWPSRVTEYNGIQNIRNTVVNARSLAGQYHTFILALKNYKASRPERITHLSLFFHSMGNAVFKNFAVHYNTAELGKCFVNNIIFNAACVPERKHRKWMELLGFQDQIYVIYNRKDRTLRAASWLFHKRLLGCQPKPPLANNAVYINIHLIALNRHNYFLDQNLLSVHPGMKLLFHSFFHATPVDINNPHVFRKSLTLQEYTLL